jgi:hypothetical protein
MTLVLDRPPRIVLKPEDFRTTLYITIFADDGKEMTSREEIAYRQDHVYLKVVHTGRPSFLAIFDRPSGGDELFRDGLVYYWGGMPVIPVPDIIIALTGITWP